MLPVVVVMVKAPRAGLVKTRLVPPLTPERAAALAACFARDAVGCAGASGAEVVIAYTPADGRATLEALLPGGLGWLCQRGRDLGERLEDAAARLFAEGRGPVVFVGTDSPTLPPSYVAEGLAALRDDEADVALGPTEDGGYYLVGLRAAAPGLFHNIAWSTPRAYADTVHAAARLGLRLCELPAWYDVDTHADLARLRAELAADPEARRRAPATTSFLFP